METLVYASFTFCFLVGAFIVVMQSSPNNKLRLSAWLQTSARAQIETRATQRVIQDKARKYQRVLEADLLKSHNDHEMDQSRVMIVEERGRIVERDR